MPDQPEYLALAATAAEDEVGPLKHSSPGSGRELAVILGAVLLQLAVLVAMITGNTAPYIGGQTVLLRVVPVDPRDLMRGDYVTLSYDISRMSPAIMGGNSPGDATNRKVYVSLEPEPDGRHFKERPRASRDPRADPTSRERSQAGGGLTSASNHTTCKKAKGMTTRMPFESDGSLPRSSWDMMDCQAFAGW